MKIRKGQYKPPRPNLLVWGPPGTGKTLCSIRHATEQGRTVVLDLENTADLYAGLFDFDVAAPSTFAEMCSFITTCDYDSVVVDSLTIPWNACVAASEKGASSLLYPVANRAFDKLLDAIATCGKVVVATARAATAYAGTSGGGLSKKGIRPDCGGGAEYAFSYEIFLQSACEGQLTKKRLRDFDVANFVREQVIENV